MRVSLDDRIEAKVDRSGGPDACHLWRGYRGPTGTPSIGYRKGTVAVRRYLYGKAHGPAPGNRFVRMKCGVQHCVNVAHMHLTPWRDPVARFWSHVEKTDGCWNWTAHLLPGGYGHFQLGTNRTDRAHRFSYKLHFGPIPKDDGIEWCVCHRCDNPRCVRPDHLFLGTDRDNMHDMMRKGRHPTLKAHHIRKPSSPSGREEP